MPSINKALRRDNKINKRRNGHQTDTRSSVATEEEKKKRVKEWERRRQEKEASVGG